MEAINRGDSPSGLYQAMNNEMGKVHAVNESNYSPQEVEALLAELAENNTLTQRLRDDYFEVQLGHLGGLDDTAKPSPRKYTCHLGPARCIRIDDGAGAGHGANLSSLSIASDRSLQG